MAANGGQARFCDWRGAGGTGGAIKNPGAWLTTKLMAMAKERGIQITRHPGETRRP